MIGIFKVNNKCDGGSYIDQFLLRILNEKNMSAVYFHSGHKQFGANEIEARFNYKNPIVALVSLYKIIRKHRLNVIYTNQFIVLFYFAILKIFFRIQAKVIGKVDGRTIKLGIKKHVFWLYDALWDFAKARADLILFETKKAKNLWRRPSKVFYTPAVNFYGIRLEAERPKVLADVSMPVVLYVGRYSEEKGYDRIRDLAIKFPSCLFVMVGGGSPSFQTVPNIREVGTLSVEEVIPYYTKANILIVPSRDDSFPSVIREFSWFNKPMVATNVGAMAEFKELGLEMEIVENSIEGLVGGLNAVLQSSKSYDGNRNIYNQQFNPENEAVLEKYRELFR